MARIALVLLIWQEIIFRKHYWFYYYVFAGGRNSVAYKLGYDIERYPSLFSKPVVHCTCQLSLVDQHQCFWYCIISERRYQSHRSPLQLGLRQ